MITWTNDGNLKMSDTVRPETRTIGPVQPGDRSFFYHPDTNRYYFIRNDRVRVMNPLDGRSDKTFNTVAGFFFLNITARYNFI